MFSISEGILLENFDFRLERGGSWQDFMQVLFFFNYHNYREYFHFQISQAPHAIISSPIGINITYDLLQLLLDRYSRQYNRVFIFLPFIWMIFRLIREELQQYFSNISTKQLKISILAGKRNFCLHESYSLQYDCNKCEFKRKLIKTSRDEKIKTYIKFNDQITSFIALSQIKEFLSPLGCPYYFFYYSFEYADIILTTHSYLINNKMRIFFTKDILRNEFLGNSAIVLNGEHILKATESKIDKKNLIQTCEAFSAGPLIYLAVEKENVNNLGFYQFNNALRNTLISEYQKNPNHSNEEKDIYENTLQFFSCNSKIIYKDENSIGKLITSYNDIFNYLNSFDSAIIQIPTFETISQLPNCTELENYTIFKFPFAARNIQFLNFSGHWYNIFSKLPLAEKWKYYHEIASANPFGNTLLIFENHRVELYSITQNKGELYSLTKESYAEAYETVGKLYYCNFEDNFFNYLEGIKNKTLLSPFKIIIFAQFPSDYKEKPIREFRDKKDEQAYDRFKFSLRLHEILGIGINKIDDFCSVVFLNAPSEYFKEVEYRTVKTDTIRETIERISEFWGLGHVY